MWGLLKDGEVAPQSSGGVSGHKYPQARPCDIELCLLGVSGQAQASLVLGEAAISMESLKLPGQLCGSGLEVATCAALEPWHCLLKEAGYQREWQELERAGSGHSW